MTEQNGIIEIDLKGNIQSKLGEFESMEEASLSKIIKNILLMYTYLQNLCQILA